MCHARHAYPHRAARRPERDVPGDDPRQRAVRRLGDHPGLRASDAERESAVTLLREHGAAGRLDVPELEQRVAGAYAAKTHGDLAALLRDLPDAQLPAPRPASGPQRAAPRDRLEEGGWAAFAVVNVILVAIWAFTGADYFWPGWVMASWALALVLRTGPRILRLR
jgi:hypothetical protein